MTSGGRYDREVQLGKEQTAEAMALIGSEPVAEKQGAQLFYPPTHTHTHPESQHTSPAPYHTTFLTRAVGGKQEEMALIASQE